MEIKTFLNPVFAIPLLGSLYFTYKLFETGLKNGKSLFEILLLLLFMVIQGLLVVGTLFFFLSVSDESWYWNTIEGKFEAISTIVISIEIVLLFIIIKK